MKKSRRWMLGGLVLLLLAPAPAVAAQAARVRARTRAAPRSPAVAPSRFIRFRETGEREGVLETAIARYRNPAGVEVDLVAAVHIADRSYYEALNRRFRKYDVVLYEMIKPKTADPARRGKGTNAISFLQRTLKNVLDLEFQLDAIDYGRKNFVHADMDPGTFLREEARSGESIFKLLIRSVFKQWQMEMTGRSRSFSLPELIAALFSEDSARALKYLFGHEMANVEQMLNVLGGEKGTVLIEGRNRVAVRVLREQVKQGKKRLAIFYGGGHMPDLEARLEKELKMKKVGEEWLCAWDIRSPATRKREAEKARRKKRTRREV